MSHDSASAPLVGSAPSNVKSPKSILVSSGGGGGGRRFFGFWRGAGAGASGGAIATPTNNRHQTKRNESMEANTEQQHSNSLPSVSVIGSAPIVSPPVPAPRRRWLRYPVRVPILSLLLVSLLARSSEGWTSIAGFVCGFLLFEGFSAPDTGQPNRIDTLVRRWILACKRIRGKKKRTKQEKQEQRTRMSRLVLCLRFPFVPCRRRPTTPRVFDSDADVNGDGESESVDSSVTALLGADDNEEDSDVLLDVAVSVCEDQPRAEGELQATEGGPTATPTLTSPAMPAAGTPTSSRANSADSHITPLHPLTDLTSESITESISDSITELTDSLPSLPTVSPLDAADRDLTAASLAAHHDVSSVVGGVAHWAHMSISLRFTLYNFHIHLHHWVYLLIILLFLYLEQHYWKQHAASSSVYSFASAFCLGGSVQGLKYADWANVIWRKQQEKKQHERRNSRIALASLNRRQSNGDGDNQHHPHASTALDQADDSTGASPHSPSLLSHLDASFHHDEEDEVAFTAIPPLLPLNRIISAPTIKDIEAQQYEYKTRQ